MFQPLIFQGVYILLNAFGEKNQTPRYHDLLPQAWDLPLWAQTLRARAHIGDLWLTFRTIDLERSANLVGCFLEPWAFKAWSSIWILYIYIYVLYIYVCIYIYILYKLNLDAIQTFDLWWLKMESSTLEQMIAVTLKLWSLYSLQRPKRSVVINHLWHMVAPWLLG